MNNTMSTTMQKIPGIGDIPILGLLFKSKAAQKNQTELVVMITPEILPNNSRGVTPNLPRLQEPYLPPLADPKKPVPPPAPAFGARRSAPAVAAARRRRRAVDAASRRGRAALTPRSTPWCPAARPAHGAVARGADGAGDADDRERRRACRARRPRRGQEGRGAGQG